MTGNRVVTQTVRVDSLSSFMNWVQTLRVDWPSPKHKELWFRGERLAYQNQGTFLHPVLYRATNNKTTSKILAKEVELYDDFMRCAVQLSDGKAEGEDWDWDAYFLMRHHGAPTRLLDWSDGALIALHFAVLQSGENDDTDDAVVYALEPDALKDHLESLPDATENKAAWAKYRAAHKLDDYDDDDYERSYLPLDKDDREELPLPIPPMVLEFPHITRRVAAQRSRFIVLGSEPSWLASRFGKCADVPVRSITIDGKSKKKIRCQLRDSGVTESVIFPDLDGLGRELLRLFWEWKL
jgi:hypothetical protein